MHTMTTTYSVMIKKKIVYRAMVSILQDGVAAATFRLKLW